ncbi:MAG: hemerythrin domain-containing protein [Proteobacteria bacterium]|nr:MAG: hemerythrin domain-containing protein [Pseudomonadota bacterium]
MKKTTAKTKTSAVENEAPDAIKFLEAQHREVEDLFKKMEDLSDRAHKSRGVIFEEIAQKLSHHAKIEELIFYPEGKDVDKDLTLEAYEEHDVVKQMIAKIKRTETGDETYMAKVTVLKEVVEHHVKEEEEEYFPKTRKEFGDEHLKELGAKLKAKFDKLEAKQA